MDHAVFWQLGVGHVFGTGELSGGQKQGVAIARVLEPGADLVLADKAVSVSDGLSGRTVVTLMEQ
jgi:ABC-type phosphate/phosphonate transport system ATPase subunit